MNNSYPSEWIEAQALRQLHAVAGKAVAAELGLSLLEFDGTLVSIAPPTSAIVINRAQGLGLMAPASMEQCEKIVDAYRQAGVNRYFLQVHPQAMPTQIERWMTKLGLKKARGWQKFERGTEALISGSRQGPEVRKISPQQSVDFASIVCAGFDLGDRAVPWLSNLPLAQDWHVFVNYVDGQPAGGGAVFIQDDLVRGSLRTGLT